MQNTLQVIYPLCIYDTIIALFIVYTYYKNGVFQSWPLWPGTAKNKFCVMYCNLQQSFQDTQPALVNSLFQLGDKWPQPLQWDLFCVPVNRTLFRGASNGVYFAFL